MNSALQQGLPKAEVDADLGTLAILAILWRGKWWITGLSLLGALCLATYAIFFATPLFPAQATVVLEDQEQQVIGDIDSIFAAGGTDTTAINTEIEVFLSGTLVGELVDELNLVEDPEFNGLGRESSLIGLLVSYFSSPESVEPSPEQRRNHTIDTLTSRLRVTNVRQSFVFRLSIETESAAKSALIVNRWAELYTESQIRRRLDEATRAIEFLSERTTELEANLEMMEQDLARQTEESNVVNAEVLQAQNLQLRDLRERVEEQRTRLIDDQVLLAQLQSAEDSETLADLAEASGDGRFTSVLRRLRAGQLSEDGAILAFQALVEDLDEGIRRATTQLMTLERSAEALVEQINEQSNELIVLQQMEREVETARLLYQSFLTRLQEASVQQGLEDANSRIITLAVPRDASSPRTALLAMLGCLLGAMAGVAFVVIRELRFASFRTVDDLRNLVSVPVLGTLPSLKKRGRREVLANLINNPNSIFAEAVRNLRTSILMTNMDRETKVILVTSSIPAEGKTTASIALSRYFGSLEQERVLLVEADVRRQTLRAYVNEDRNHGVQLIDVMLGRVNLDDVDLSDAEIGVDVLMGSGGNMNATDMFESRRFADLMSRLRERYDYIIIDSPPVLAVPDARVLARFSDITVFAVRWNYTTRTQLRQGLEMLDGIGVTADGLVLTQVDAKKMRKYGYSGQYGYDAYSSGYYSAES